MARKDVEKQHVLHNMALAPGDRLISGNWRFKGSVLFYHGAAYCRIVKPAKGRPIMLQRSHYDADFTVMAGPRTVKAYGIDYRVWDEIPDLGVRSRYEGDMLSDGELVDERMKWLFLMQISSVVDDWVKQVSGLELAGAEGDKIIGNVENQYMRWHNWSETFGLGWGQLSPHYRVEVKRAIEAKVDRYHDPRSIEQRERNHARRIAKKALGLT